jgi:hypothetical protein
MGVAEDLGRVVCNYIVGGTVCYDATRSTIIGASVLIVAGILAVIALRTARG